MKNIKLLIISLLVITSISGCNWTEDENINRPAAPEIIDEDNTKPVFTPSQHRIESFDESELMNNEWEDYTSNTDTAFAQVVSVNEDQRFTVNMFLWNIIANTENEEEKYFDYISQQVVINTQENTTWVGLEASQLKIGDFVEITTLPTEENGISNVYEAETLTAKSISSYEVAVMKQLDRNKIQTIEDYLD